MPTVLVLTLGATALQSFDAASGLMAQRRDAPSLLLAHATDGLQGIQTLLQALPYRSGAELTFETLTLVRDAVLAALPDIAGAVLLAGTDTLEETAFVLHLMLCPALGAAGKLLCLTGAMLPADQLGADGPANLRDAILIVADAGVRRLAGGSVLLTLNQRIHLAQYVRKADSSLIGAFQSHPGPIGEMRGGRPLLYYVPPPPPQQQQQPGEPSAAQEQRPPPEVEAAGGTPPWLPHAAFQRVRGGALAGQRVAIWTLTAGALAPPEALLQQLDGLVLAGSGTGSLSAATLEALAPWTAHLPCVVSSRCGCGANHDNFCYRGSLEKYESRGFILRGGYEELNPLQARALLVMRLAALGRAVM